MAQPGSAAAPTRIFLSYGHRDATDLALRIRADLDAAGYRVWQDETAIRAGHAWTDEIRQGIRDSDLIVALLSPHSVRRAGWSDTPEDPDRDRRDDGDDDRDSVCLDEIEYAIDACRIPVLPVMAVTCEPPFRIYRLQYLDLRAWRESAARYEQLWQTLRAGVADCLTSGRAPLRRWDRLPAPWDFTPFLVERRRRFTGRTWLFGDLRDSVATNRITLITGAPGVGKSAFVAELIHANPAGQILAYHCCQASTPATLSPSVFVRSVVAMMASRDAAYAALIENPDVVAALTEAAVAADPASAFEQLVLGPLHALPEPERPRVLVVDALDEALSWERTPTIVDLLAGRVAAFPTWLRVVATARDVPVVRRRFRTAHPLELIEAAEQNVNDLRDYVATRLDHEPLRTRVGRRRTEVARMILDRAAGNFLVVSQTVDALASGLIDLDELQALAPGLEPLYEDFFDRLFARAGLDYAPTCRLLQAVLTAQEPPNREQLAAVTGFGADTELPDLLGRVAPFVPPRDGRYSPFHKTVTEWLTGWDAHIDQPVAGPYHVGDVAGHRLWATPLLGRYASGPDAWDEYLRRYLPVHLAGAHQWDDLARVLLDLRMLEAVTQGPRTTVFTLLGQFEAALAAVPRNHDARSLLSLVSESLHLDAAFVAEFPGSLFQCLWNRGHWHDGPQAPSFFDAPAGAPGPWAAQGPRLGELVDRWRSEKDARSPGHVWLRALRPMPEVLGGPLRGIIRADSDSFSTVSVSADGERIVASQSGTGLFGIWDTRTATPLAQTDLAEEVSVHCVRFVPDGPRMGEIAAVTWDGRLVMFDEGLQVVDQTRVTDDNLSRVALSPDGSLIATGDWRGEVTVWSTDPLAALGRWTAHDGQVTALEFSPCGRFLASGNREYGSSGNFVRIWTVDQPGTWLAEQVSRHWVECVCFTADGAAVYWADYGGRVTRWDWTAGAGASKGLSQLRGEGSPVASLLLVDEDRLLCGVGGAFDPVPVEVWNLADKRLQRRLDGHLFTVQDLARVPGTTEVVSAGDSTLRLWDLASIGTSDVTVLEPEVEWIVFAEPRGLAISAASTSGELRVRRLTDGAAVTTLSDQGALVSAIALSPDARRLAVCAADGSLRLWDLGDPTAPQPTRRTTPPTTPTTTPLWSVRHHTARASALTFSPDGALVVTGADDGRVAVVDATDGTLRRRSGRRPDWLQHLALSHDGSRLAVGGLEILEVRSFPGLRAVRPLEHVTHYGLWFSTDDSLLVAEVPGQLGAAWTIATGKPLPPGPQVDALFDEAMGRSGRRWQWSSPGNLGYAQEYLKLVDTMTGLVVAAFPEIQGGLAWHPDGRTWVNTRSRRVALLRLEGPAG